jgi:uncharacterized protein (TIGR02145 family)
MRLSTVLIGFFISSVLYMQSCKKEYNNPYDPATDPHFWMPDTLYLEVTGFNSAKLHWDQKIRHIDGYAITKKYAAETFEYFVNKDSLFFSDTAVLNSANIGSCKNVHYSVRAVAGNQRSSEQMLTVVFPFTSLALAGSDQLVALDSLSTKLTANVPPTYETGKWSVITGNGGSVADVNNPQSLFSGQPGTYTLRWTISGPCDTTYDEVNITFHTTVLDLPLVSTSGITNITTNTATGGGSVTSDGGAPVTARGVCFGTSQNPTTANSMVSGGGGIGNFTSNISGLTASTTYYVRAFATNLVGTTYGNEVVFATSDATLPNLTTTVATSITGTSAVSGGNVTNDGGAPVTSRGLCYDTSTNPTTNNNVVSSGSGLGNFVANMSGLATNTTYYVRAFATNSAGTAYGNEIVFSTATLPTLTTTSVTSITSTTAISGGDVTSNGGGSVTSRGVCYDTTNNPTILDSKVVSGSGLGTFSTNLTGLKGYTKYFVRAYATNSVGTAYGNEYSFTTTSMLATNATCDSQYISVTGCGGQTTLIYNGYTYQLVEIGGQCWFAENLRATTYRDGTQINYPGTDTIAWTNNTSGAYAYYSDNISNGNIYGALYNWYAVNNPKRLCPNGWHIPSDCEWMYLENSLGMSVLEQQSSPPIGQPRGTDQGTQMKSISGWYDYLGDPWGNGTNSSGFNALPAGYRSSLGKYLTPTNTIGSFAVFWSNSIVGSSFAYVRRLNNSTAGVDRTTFGKSDGVSCRCVKD